MKVCKIISCFMITFILPLSPLSAQISSPGPVMPVSSISADRVGIVAAVKGSVQIASQGQAGKIVESGQPVFLGDTVSTNEKGSLQILLMDQTVFTIGPNSSIVIDQFVYDPVTHDGAVKAKVVKGVFRFVTGKIGQKNPQQMEVDLPSGTIAIRGTIVAGEVTGEKSLVVLLGPGEKNNTGHRGGKFTLSNESNGEMRQETVAKTGFGSTIEGLGAAPSKPFQLQAEQMSRLTKALGPLPVDRSQPQANQIGDDQDAESEAETIDNNSEKSPTEQSGQGKAGARESIKESRAIGGIIQKLGREVGQASQDSNDGIFGVKDGPSSRDQLQSVAQNFGGIAHFESLHVPVTGAYSSGNETADFKIDIDFGGRKVGGGNSSVTGNIFSGNTYSFSIALTASQPFGSGPENAQFLFPVSSVGGTCGALCDTANVNVGVDNRGGKVAQEAHMLVKIFDGGIEKAQAVTIGQKVDGPS